MAIIIGFVSQKGGVGKSSEARTVAVAFAAAGWTVLLADMDIQQSTSFEWNARRLQHDFQPHIDVQQFHSVDRVLTKTSHYDLIIFDGAPHATLQTEQIAKVANLLILPTGSSLDDMTPQVKLAHELYKKGTERSKIAFTLSRMGKSDKEVLSAREYVSLGGYTVIQGCIREMDAYKQAMDMGKTMAETKYPSLNAAIEEVTQGIVDLIKSATVTTI